MSSAVSSTEAIRSRSRRKGRIGALLLGLGALILWIGSRMRWVSVDVNDELSGASQHELVGATWSTESMAVALVLLVAMIAGLALRRLGRRLSGIIGALAAVGVSLTPVRLLTAGADPERAHNLLLTGAASQRADAPVSIAEWAEVTATSVQAAGPVVALIGAAVAVFGAVLLATQPGADGAKMNKYERAAARREKLAEDLENSPDSGRVMWDALDDDIDPTDTSADRR
ncbi:TIGR02234 family membrane protein [Corynebacterium yudongzhengii]|uniref:TIGR02234 family membrane protein n=1 Tax=Corynebacterium yudongzhengii TaxID=2080740 RepID=A0A2U1T6I2_9CORY|nr:TIGR02234 family membrane protein [Corynebacterium yudongzhengii]AWB81617.1 TIGR02234 family membrane protein [Corynebacterium yudongzhengii]PWC01602.1 TIGR02234 family membrane protein [Corynebacterium yudongzhengii]